MPELDFKIVSAEVKPFAAVPTLIFKMQVTNAIANEEVYAAGLKGQVMIEAVKRRYDRETQERLLEVFGEPARWEETLNSLFWTYVTIPVPRFTGKTVVDIPIQSSEDLTVAAGKYFYAIQDGVVPLVFLFSGTIFYKSGDENLQITQVPWEKEATFKLPIETWQKMIESHFPNSRWVRVQKDTFDKLYQYKTMHAIPTMEACLDRLIERVFEESQQAAKKDK